ncbi:hypothetical protein CRE_07371 [Caenorhabditis remanei]|uniref:Uncharacterized protein n=1 Tax=Caenorhabditis remanei TaxID=31234 RepID=E3M2J3_CAERE|nr:hypothetical protein CRE_07371 [Caenorhabditis remanei]
MKMECKFLSNPELDKPMGVLNRCMSNELNEEPKQIVKKPAELKVTCLFGVMNGTGVSDRIASGRFGTMYIGTIMDTTLQVAIKEYHPTFNDLMLTAKNEGTDLHKLINIKHPCLLQSYTVDKFRDIVYRVMELCPTTVHADLLTAGKYNEDRIKVVLVQVTRALEYLHAQGVYHGTLHTKNIFIKDNMVKVSDIESNRLLKWVPYARTPLFILPFIAPELHGKLNKLTPECDLWSLGICLFVMATGFSPFRADTRGVLVKNIQNGVIRAPVLSSLKIRDLFKGMIRVNASERTSLNELIKDKWISSENVWDSLIPFHKDLMDELKKPTIHRPLAKGISKVSLQSNDEGYNSVVTDQPGKPGKDGGEPDESPAVAEEEIPKRYYKNFAVFAMENNREEWDPNLLRLERCKLSNGSNCLKIVIPAIDDPTPSLMSRIQEQIRQRFRRLRPSQENNVSDADYGDYALMSFRRNRTTMESMKNAPKFANARQAQFYYCKQEADRVWASLDMSVCMRCRRLGTDSIEHEEERCLYKMFADAVDTNEVIFCGREDQYNVRYFTLVYRNDGGRLGSLARFRRGSMKVLSSGYQRFLNKIRRQPAKK